MTQNLSPHYKVQICDIKTLGKGLLGDPNKIMMIRSNLKKYTQTKHSFDEEELTRDMANEPSFLMLC